MATALKPVDLRTVIRDERRAIEALCNDRRVAIDIETSGLSPFRDKVAVVSLHGQDSGATAVLHCRGHLSDDLRQFLGRGDVTYVGHNVGGFDALFLHTHGVDVFRSLWFDTMIAEAVSLASGRRDLSVSLKATLARRVGKKIDKGQQLSTWMADQLTPEQLQYCCDDVRMLPGLMDEYLRKAGGTPMRQAIATEMKVLPVVMHMSLNGLPVLAEAMHDFRQAQFQRMIATTIQLQEWLGDINLDSPIQLRRALAQRGVDLPGTAFEVIKPIADLGGELGDHMQTLLDWRGSNQRLKMYTDDWIRANLSYDGAAHARFWQCGTETLRFSSSDPNLQQVPRDMRQVFGKPGHRMVSGDYSQVEIVIAAFLARDVRMRAALESGDVHTDVAATVFQVPKAQVTPGQRKSAKAMRFTLLFGGGSGGLYNYAKLQGSPMTEQESRQNVAAFFTMYQGLAAMREKANIMARAGAPVTLNLPTGARRVLVGKTLTGTRILNTSVQGAAAAALKFGLVECARRGIDKYIGATVHDEIVSCVPESEAADYAVELGEAMMVGLRQVIGDFPARVEVKNGEAWS